MFFDDIRMRAEEVSQGPLRNPIHIHMPHIKSIFQAQGFDDIEMVFIFALLGRLFHMGKRFDNWSVFPWFLGIGATGKSTILKLIAMMYNPEDIGYLPNKPSADFSLATAYQGLLYLALDIDNQFSFDQATFCSMVSHEQVVINLKNKDQISKDWESHGAAASNTMPAKFTDAGNNLVRRIVNIEFAYTIKDSNPNLFEWCVNERPEFLHVCNSCYLMLAELYRNVSFKSQMPQKFKDMEKRCMREMNPVNSFVTEACVLVHMDQKQSMSKNDFIEAFNWWAAINNLPKQQCKLTSVSFYSLRNYGVNSVDTGGQAGTMLENIQLAPHVIPLIAEWKQNKGRGG
jgi:phage/plasmid-associated DNA primase